MMLSETRIRELLDYASVYGEFDETTPIGTRSTHNTVLTEGQRHAIISYKKVLGLLDVDYVREASSGSAENGDGRAFAKLFDTSIGQLLVIQEYDDDEHPESPFRLRFRGAAYNGVEPAVEYGWATEQARDESFASIDQAEAEVRANGLAAMLRSFMAGEAQA